MGRPRKNPSVEPKITDIREQIEVFGEEASFYDRETAFKAYNEIGKLAAQGATQGEFEQDRVIAIKLDAALLLKRIASSRGDQTTADMMTDTEQTLATLLEALQPAEETVEAAKPAATSKAKTGAAKSPELT